MKLAIVTRGDLPVPAVKGGAVESLTDLFINQNELYKEHNLLVYSISDKAKIRLEHNFQYTTFFNIKTKSPIFRIKNILRKLQTRLTGKYCGDEYIYQIINNLKLQSFDYIIVENIPVYSIILKRKFPNIPIIQHLHNSYITSNCSYKTEILKANDYVFGVSDFIRKEVMNTYESIGFNGNNVYTWYNAINENYFKPIDANSYRISLDFSPDDFIILFSGRIVEAKGIDKLLEAMRLLTEYSNIKLLIIGGTSFANSKQTPFSIRIKELCEACKGKIRFTGYVDYKQIYKYYDIADICVFPSMWNEPFALTALEAMTMGKPIIATKSGGLVEVVNDKCAILLERDEKLTNNIAEAILFLYNNLDIRTSMGIHAKKRSKQFSSQIYYERFNELLRIIS